MKSVAEKSLEFTSLFEAELLVRLMLQVWEHPFAKKEDFANGLLEDASGALRNAMQGEQLIDSLAPADLNFVAAVWYAERCAVESGDGEQENTAEVAESRRAWLSAVRHALPSCFCDPSDLH